MSEPKSPRREVLENSVERAYRHGSLAHGRIDHERAVERERRCEHSCRWAADTVEREAELSLSDGSFDLFRYVGRIDDDNVSADRFELGHELRAPDDVYSLQAARFRERDHPSPDCGVGGVLHHPLARLQVDVLAEQQ